MGVVNYLAREDNGTLYEIGKVWSWRLNVLGNGELFSFPIDDAELGELAGQLKLRWDESLTERCPVIYFSDVARDMARWADGKPVRCVTEFSGLIERWQDQDMDASIADSSGPDYTARFLARITGDRYQPALDEWKPLTVVMLGGCKL